MEDLVTLKESVETQSKTEVYSFSKSNFEEDLRRQNIDTMVEIYGEKYLEKIGKRQVFDR